MTFVLFRTIVPFFVSALLWGGSAVAASLGLVGNYGDANGCAFAKTKEYSEKEFVLLTPDDVSTAVTLCEFVQVLPHRGGSVIVTAQCGHEGDEEQTIAMLRIQKEPDGVDAYRIYDANGGEWGKVDRCT